MDSLPLPDKACIKKLSLTFICYSCRNNPSYIWDIYMRPVFNYSRSFISFKFQNYCMLLFPFEFPVTFNELLQMHAHTNAVQTFPVALLHLLYLLKTDKQRHIIYTIKILHSIQLRENVNSLERDSSQRLLWAPLYLHQCVISMSPF